MFGDTPGSESPELMLPEVGMCSKDVILGTEVEGSWVEQEVGQSSTWRELESVRRVLISNVQFFFGTGL